jgi:hypothetical protein
MSLSTSSPTITAAVGSTPSSPSTVAKNSVAGLHADRGELPAEQPSARGAASLCIQTEGATSASRSTYGSTPTRSPNPRFHNRTSSCPSPQPTSHFEA